MAYTFSTSQLLNLLRKWGACVAFWLANVLRATTACTFSTSQLLKVVRRWCAVYILNWKCASHHNCVQFVITHLARWFRTRRFSEPTFRPEGSRKLPESFQKLPQAAKGSQKLSEASEASSKISGKAQRLPKAPGSSQKLLGNVPGSQKAPSHKSLEKHSESRLSYLFVHLHLLSSHSFSSLIFSLLLPFSDCSHLCFSICPYCRKFDF